MYTIKLITGKEITLSDTPNKSQLVALFEACKQARPDLFTESDTQPEETPESYKILNVTASSVGILVEKLIQKQQAENFTERYLRALFTQMPTTPAEIVQAADAAGMKDALLAAIMDSYEVNPMV